MKNKYLIFLILFSAFLLGHAQAQDPKSFKLYEDSLRRVVDKFGTVANLWYVEGVNNTYGQDQKPNEDGKSFFYSLFDTMAVNSRIINFIDPKIAGLLQQSNYQRSLDTLTKQVPGLKLYLSPREYVAELERIYYSGTTSKVDGVGRLVPGSEKRIAGKRYQVLYFIPFYFSGDYVNENTETTRNVFDNQDMLFTISYRKIKNRDQLLLSDFRIDNITKLDISGGGVKDSTYYLFSVEPYLNGGIIGNNHVFAEEFEPYLSSKVGISTDIGVNVMRTFKPSEMNRGLLLDVGMGLGYSRWSFELASKEYGLVKTNEVPPFQASGFLKQYDYLIQAAPISQAHHLSLISTSVFTRLRVPLKISKKTDAGETIKTNGNSGLFFKLGFNPIIPLNLDYRPDGKIGYTGVFKYLVNNQEVVISTDQGDGNLKNSIPDYDGLYGLKEAVANEKPEMAVSFLTKIESGMTFNLKNLHLLAGAYFSYNISGFSFKNGADLISKGGKMKSLLTKTDRFNPIGFGLSVSTVFDINKIRLLPVTIKN